MSTQAALHRAKVSELLQRVGDRVGGHCAGIQPAEYQRVHGAAHAEEHLGDGDGHQQPEKAVLDAPVEAEKAAQRDVHRFFEKFAVDDEGQQLDDAGTQRADGRAGDAQCRQPELAEDETVVKADIQRVGEHVDEHGHAHVLDGPQRGDERDGDSVQRVGERVDAQVPRPGGDDGHIAGKDAHDGHRLQKHHHRRRQTDEEGVAHAGGDDFGDGGEIPLAPVLAEQRGGGAGSAIGDAVDDGEHLIAQRRGGHGRFAQLAQHDAVDHAHAKIEDI